MKVRRLAAALALVLPAVGGAQATVVRFGRLIDGTGRVLRDAYVVVDSGRITSVGTGSAPAAAAARTIDLRRYTGIPGLIDVHTHMTYYWDPSWGGNPWRQPQRLPAVTVYLAQANAKKTLEAGVTTVRDLGSSAYNAIAMRELIDRGYMVGPRMFVAGYGLSKPRPGRPAGNFGPAQGRATGVDEVKQAVEAQVKAGVDVIKMYGSTGSADDVTGTETYTFDEMKAAVDAAHAAGKRIAIHSYGPVGGTDAERAGANSVEHAVSLDDSTLADMAARGTFYVPTIDHNRYYAEYAKDFGYGPRQIAGLDSFRVLNMETARRAFRAGVKMAMGSDAVFTMFGQNTRELADFVAIGMAPAQALATATTNAAELLGMGDRLGRVAPGYYADLVAVDGDPITDIGAVISGVKWVMKGGAVVVDKR